MIDPLCTLSVRELARRIRTREVSAVQVVRAHVARIKQVNGRLNAVVVERFSDALRDARQADRLLDDPSVDRDRLPPFLGVPFTVKEMYEVEGFPTTGGLVRRRDRIARADATVVARMKAAGFVLLGVTNVPEALTWIESYNKVYGRTNNAYSEHHTPGGSSGGEGAVIGVGGSPVGLGGDIAGSIRNPAFFNGVCGHKPSGGRVPGSGAWPGVEGDLLRYRVSGPLGRRVDDLRAVMPLLVGPDGLDPSVDGPDWAPHTGPKPTVYTFTDIPWARASAEVRAGLDRARSTLSDQGYRVVEWTPPHLDRAPELWLSAMAAAEGNKFIDSLGDHRPVSLRQQWARWPLRRSDHILPCLLLATFESLVRRRGRPDAPLKVALQQAIEEKLGDDGVLLFPTFHTAAPRHGLDCLRHTLGFLYCAVLNPLELPATAVPTGFGERSGLPVGVQIAARRHGDALTLHVAEAVERGLGGWRPPGAPR